MNLGELIAPISQDDFIDQYWESETLFVSRNDPSYFASLFSLKDLDHLVGTSP